MADPKKTASKSTAKKTTSNKSNAGIKPVTGKIVPFSGKIEPVSYRPSTTTKKSTTTSKSSTSSKPKSTTTSKTSSSKVTDKKVVKKDGQTTVTYSTPYKSMIGTYPSKVRKIYDDKGNLIKGNQRVQGSYGSYQDIGIKGSKKAAPLKKATPKPSVSTKTTSTKPSTPKYVKPGTKEYWAMTPDQRNANTMLNIKESIAGPKKSTTTKKSTTPSKPKPPIAKAPVSKAPVKKPTTPTYGKNVTSKEGAAKIKGIVEGLERAPQKKKTETKPKPVAPKMPTVIGSAKVSVPSKGKVKIEPNMGKPKSFTAPKTETKPKVQTTPKPAAPEPIKMETIPLATVAKQLQESRPKAELEIPKSMTPAAKTSAPAEEKKGIFARMKERREARKAEREAEKKNSAGDALAMKKGGMVRYQKGGSTLKAPSSRIPKAPGASTTRPKTMSKSGPRPRPMPVPGQSTRPTAVAKVSTSPAKKTVKPKLQSDEKIMSTSRKIAKGITDVYNSQVEGMKNSPGYKAYKYLKNAAGFKKGGIIKKSKKK